MNSFFVKPVLLPVVRWWLRMLQTHRPDVHLAEKVARATLAIPVFSVLVAALRARTVFWGPLEAEAVTDDGLRYRAMLPDLIQMYLALFGVWEPDLVRFARSRVNEGDVVIDVGANIGAFALPAARAVGAAGKVIAFEPVPAIHADLRRNLAQNQLSDRVVCIPAAASDVVGQVMIHAGPASNLGKSSRRRRRGLGEPVAVEAAPLPQLVDDADLARARLIKIDVEGAEDEVLRGLAPAIGLLRQDVEILVELSPAWWSDTGQTADDLLGPFRAAGFNVYEIENNYWPWRYLWPECVSRPRRVRHTLRRRVKRLDLILSRVDAKTL